MEAVLEDPYILITDKKLSSVQDLLPALERILQVTKNIVILADDVDGEALATLVVNKLRGTINAIAIKAPSFGDRVLYAKYSGQEIPRGVFGDDDDEYMVLKETDILAKLA